MKIWVDADSCPRQIRTIVLRAVKRTGIQAVFVANQALPISDNDKVQTVLVGKEEGAADDYIEAHAAAPGIAITRDIPLAAKLVEIGIIVLDDRGSVYTGENIRERLSLRNFMKELRDAGLSRDKSRAMTNREVMGFANAFDRELFRIMKT